MTPTKPILKYPGAKWRIAQEIVQLIPRTPGYIEPFFGSGAVYFNLPFQPRHVILNDKWYHVVRFFIALREHMPEVCRAIELTPWAEAELEATHIDRLMNEWDDVEFARRFLVKSWMSNGGDQCNNSGFRKKGVGGMACNASTHEVWQGLPQRLATAVERLRHAEILCRDALEVIRYYNAEDITLYIDPPYLGNTRMRKRKMYQYEMMEEAAHTELLTTLQAHKGPVIISGYAAPLYNELLSGWSCKGIAALSNSSQPTTEVLWWNPTAQQHLSQLNLFANA